METKRPETNTECQLSRREMLQGTAAGLGVAVAGGLLAGCSPAGEQRPASQAGMITPDSLPQRFSQEEMNRRRTAIRAAMREQNFDGLLLTDRPDGGADIGWLTATDASYAVMALEGNILAIGGGGASGSGILRTSCGCRKGDSTTPRSTA